VSVVCPSCGQENPVQARFCLNCAAALPQQEESREERKLATILFADLVGSTAMADDQDPERTRLVLNRFYDAMTEEVERSGGTVEKFAGDAVMAAFGAPAALEDHAERALHTALAMHERLRDMYGGRLALRIGVNTGKVIVGRPRAGSSFVTGDVVNVAARLEQAAGPGEILAGERTVASAQGAFEFGEPTVIEAKGKPSGISAHRVMRALSLMRPRGVRGLPSVFIGRQAEFEELQDRYQSVVAGGDPQLVSILGDAGVGKTRLIREMWGWLGEQPQPPIRRTGRTLSYGRGTTYWPLGEVLKEHFAISEGEGADAIVTKLAAWPYLGLTLGINPGEELHPLVARERLHDAWVDFMTDLVRDQPAVMLIEDVHWAEDQLCDLIDTLVGRVGGPLLLLVTARPEMLDRRPAWGGAWGRTSAMRLDALEPADTSELLGQLLAVEVPRTIRDLVVQRAEGNPFFIEELIATFIDRGVVQRRNGGWTFAEIPPGFDVPDSVQAVLAARIDLLAEAEKAALQAAAVIGRTFWTGPMYELVAPAKPNVGVLEEREFVRRRPGSSLPGEREYVIKHALTREVAYESLPRGRRARLHAAFASWLDHRADGSDELAPLLAHHYAMSVRPEDLDLAWPQAGTEVERLRANAIVWSRKAADLAIGRYEIDDGIALLRRAAELEQDRTRQAEIWFEIGHACALKYDGEGFVAAMQRALEFGAAEGKVYSELAHQTVHRVGMWRRRLDTSLVDEWIENAIAASAEGTAERIQAVTTHALWHDDVKESRAALAMADKNGTIELRSAALAALQSALWENGQFLEACDVAAARIDLLATITDPDEVAGVYFMNSDLYLNVGRVADARTMAEREEEVVAGLTPHHRLHGFAARLRLESGLGAWNVVRDLTHRTEEAVEANLATPCAFNVALLVVLAAGWMRAGDRSAAARLEAKARALGMEGYGRLLSAYWLQLAIFRHDGAEIRRVIESMEPDWLTPGMWELWAALFDGLVEIGDRDRIEAEAPGWVRPDAYVAPFAVRALGVARRDATLLADAVSRFDAMGLNRHAQETRQLFGASSPAD
jgi:class 3 adenylate cyclase